MICEHKNIEAKEVIFSNGTKHVQKLCLDCNRKIGYAKQNNPIKDDFKVFLKKHVGKTYLEVYQTDKDYLFWVASENFSNIDLRNKVKEYLKSKGEKID